MGRTHKASRHGTLNEDDTAGAVQVDTQQVLDHCQTATTAGLFGAAGALPPKSAQKLEPRYVVYHTLKDDKTGQDWIGLNKVKNAEKGTLEPIPLVPGEYKLELRLPRALNKNLAHDMSGSIVGSLSSLGYQDEDKAEEVLKRGLPTSYMDVHIVVQAKKFAVCEIRGTLDLGVHASFLRTFAVLPTHGDAQLQISLYSHSVLKRLKVVGVLHRRDPAPPEAPKATRRRREANSGKAILRSALSHGEDEAKVTAKAKPGARRTQGPGQGHGHGAAPPPAPQQTRLDADVDVRAVVRDFYGVVAPQRVDNVDVVFGHFSDRHDDLINTLEAKYRVVFDRRGNFQKVTVP